MKKKLVFVFFCGVFLSVYGIFFWTNVSPDFGLMVSDEVTSVYFNSLIIFVVSSLLTIIAVYHSYRLISGCQKGRLESVMLVIACIFLNGLYVKLIPSNFDAINMSELKMEASLPIKNGMIDDYLYYFGVGSGHCDHVSPVAGNMVQPEIIMSDFKGKSVSLCGVEITSRHIIENILVPTTGGVKTIAGHWPNSTTYVSSSVIKEWLPGK